MGLSRLRNMAAAAFAIILGAIIACTAFNPLQAYASTSFDISKPTLRVALLIIQANENVGGSDPIKVEFGHGGPPSSGAGQTDKVVEVKHNFVAVDVVEPTCTELGYTLYACTTCGDTYKDSLVACLPHRFEATVVEPTCTHRGYTTYTCADCGYSYLDAKSYKDQTEHSYSATVVPPTCETAGYTVYTCTICGDEYVDDTVSALAHDFSQLIDRGTDPKCQYPGIAPTFKCVHCDATVGGEEVAPLGHDVVDTTHAPTCTEIGYVQHSCSRCGQGYIDGLVPALGHDYDTTVVGPTCTESGFTIDVCSRCGDFNVSNPVSALGHHYVAEAINPTCTDGGYIEYRCDRCDDAYTEAVNPTDHDYDEVVVPPTCTSKGYTSHTCANCGHSYIDDEVDALGHDYEIEIIDPTCTTEGSRTYTCRICGDTYTEKTGDALGHSWDTYSWIWSKDYHNASITFRCSHDESHIRSMRAVVESNTVDTTTTYIARATIDGQTFTDERSVTVIVDTPVRNPIPDGPGDSDNDSNSSDTSGNTGSSNTDSDGSSGPQINQSSSSSGTFSDTSASQDVTQSYVAQAISVSSVDAKSDGVNAIITNAPEGAKELSVASVEGGSVYNALTTAVADDIAKDDSDAEIAAIYDVKLSIDGTNYAQSFGKLTLEFPVDEKYNMRWATVYHCHNNDTSNITTFEKVPVLDGKVILSGVTRLSAFAVAIGERIDQSTPSAQNADTPSITEVMSLASNTSSASDSRSAVNASAVSRRSYGNAQSDDTQAATSVQEPVGDAGIQEAQGAIEAELRNIPMAESGPEAVSPSVSSAIESAMNTPVATVGGMKISLFHVGIAVAVVLLAGAASILVLYFRRHRA